MPVGHALEQLRELISILRELGNAGPRDNSFKQWRQVTLTLLQRMWPGDQTRAVRFRRIPFSAPSSRADAKTIRECYVRGVNEAIAYLEGLALEVEFASGKLGRNLVRPPEAPVAPSGDGPGREVPATGVAGPPTPSVHSGAHPGATAEPAPQATPPAGHPAAGRAGAAADSAPAQAQPHPHAPREQTAAAKQESGKFVTRPRQRLKDMLGFGEEGATPSTPMVPTGPMSDGAAEASAPVAPAAPIQPYMPAAPPPPAHAAPSPGPPGSDIRSSAVPREERPAPPLRLVPPTTTFESLPDLDAEAYALDFDLTDEAGSDAETPSATPWEMLERESAFRGAEPTRVAREVLSMAAMVEQLGVPPQRQAIVRAALIDLGHQMDAPPVHWVAIRQTLAFMMDYPQIARRVLPMLLPYLDEAA